MDDLIIIITFNITEYWVLTLLQAHVLTHWTIPTTRRIGTAIIPTDEESKEPPQAKSLAQGHIASKQQSWDSKLGGLAPDPHP